jgi:phosphomannomutase
VGWDTTRRVFEAAGFALPTLVDAQIAPDAAFPTVAFPNPEEPGAMDLAYETAREVGAELILANDPDADRLAIAIPDSGVEGGWRRLAGNEVGLLLGWRAAKAAKAARDAGGTVGASLACSLVSSPGLGAIAEAYGLDFHETLTGFKWISRAPGAVFGFEEALGYLVNPGTVRDKDGISAAVALLGMAADARVRGITIAGLLEELGAEIGHFASGQVSVRVEDLSIIANTMISLRAEPPASFGTRRVASVDDLSRAGSGMPSGDVLRYRLADGSRVVIRPSGTEPKLKVYIDVRADSAAEAGVAVTELEDAVRELLAERR